MSAKLKVGDIPANRLVWHYDFLEVLCYDALAPHGREDSMALMKPKTVMKLISFWPPFLVSGISIKSHDLEAGTITTQLKIFPWNRNYFGTHFGGSLYAMCDPFYVFILTSKLGRGYIVWDLKSEIEFVKAVATPVSATFSISADQVREIHDLAKTGDRVEPVFETEVVDDLGQTIARVKKTVYVRKKKK